MNISSSDMDQVIEDSINDATTDTSVDISTDAVDTSSQVDSPDLSGDTTVTDDTQSIDPLDPNAGAAVQDEFEKRWGIPARSVTGRENRIPHTRVKGMVTKAEQDGYARGLKEAETKTSPQLAEFQTKVQDYEGRLTKVAQFEHVLENDPRTFLGLLAKIPAYKEFFDYIGQLSAGQQPDQQVGYLDSKSMPPPDEILSDGTRVYSLDGLAKRDEWLARQVEEKAIRSVEDRMSARYAPMEQEWQQQQRQAQMVPVIEKQIADARTWPNFQELEPGIIQLLRSDPNITLERAYVKAYQEQVVPRASADRNKIRTELLAELKQKPISSSVPTLQVRPGTQTAGARSMEQIIRDSVIDAGLSGT